MLESDDCEESSEYIWLMVGWGWFCFWSLGWVGIWEKMTGNDSGRWISNRHETGK